ncbi:glycosyltransferase [Dysgonomonas macrotermitis]|uniref:Glycosyltransferase involved in cell wall bisynthesis n=1 Tax=Dysgonomonas macrotermitis TaxID=1346286 RepID=A0A1M5I493_9BACT|nr:glycosyltransferase [Dysgonomonas macrotermitis]SHG23061.1 Glycosyltransferase involved in cell wall bisynthesis [Dysgonomonas macrotermitis]
MRLIVNTSSLFAGGGVQVALSFLEECKLYTENEYYVFVCTSINDQIDVSSYPDNFKFYLIERKNNVIKNILFLQKILSKLEKEINPDCVFTIFGPSYWTPKKPHLLGFATGHYIYPESPFFQKISAFDRIKWELKKRLHLFFYKRNAQFFHIETHDAKKRLAPFLGASPNNIFVVSNTYSPFFNYPLKKENILRDKRENTIRFLILSAYYSHKNLDILNKVIPILREKGIDNVEFVTTLSREVYEEKFTEDAKCYMYNIGPVLAKDCPKLYSECDFLFLPTLIECFSANYPEAMKMNKPILTSDLPFARGLCEDAALYFDSDNPEDISLKIINIIGDRQLQEKLVENGKRRLKDFLTAKERAGEYLKICRQISLK